MIEKLVFERFTAFENLEIDFSPGVNICIGENGTGKTHVLKTVYAACEIIKSKKTYANKLYKVFLPSFGQIGRLAKRMSGSTKCSVMVRRNLINDKAASLKLSFSNHTKDPEKAKLTGSYNRWMSEPMEAVYIPVKDMMANAPGFRSLYNLREIHFEEIYADIID
jgi:predicted ATP-binding protein involved in virulence